MKKKIFIIIVCFLFNMSSNSQNNKELKDSIELPKLEIKNTKLEKELISEFINKNKDDWDTGFVYSIQVNEGKKKKSYKLIITLSTICDIKDSINIGFFKIQDYIFIARGIYPNTLYSISSEKRTFECIKYYRMNDSILEPILPIRWEPPIWVYSFESNKLKCVNVTILN